MPVCFLMNSLFSELKTDFTTAFYQQLPCLLMLGAWLSLIKHRWQSFRLRDHLAKSGNHPGEDFKRTYI